jgi:hypothetical protein
MGLSLVRFFRTLNPLPPPPMLREDGVFCLWVLLMVSSRRDGDGLIAWLALIGREVSSVKVNLGLSCKDLFRVTRWFVIDTASRGLKNEQSKSDLRKAFIFVGVSISSPRLRLFLTLITSCRRRVREFLWLN